ncbi:glycosyltransferase [Rummeliibacillus pycnus]|uniref:glycosyltransferase n=1 Tax=Rummeliibacillus pycnus TaxID=101070 RepID=UPI003D2CC010
MQITNIEEQLKEIQSKRLNLETEIKKEKYKIDYLKEYGELPTIIPEESLLLYEIKSEPSNMSKVEYLSYREEVADLQYFDRIKPFLDEIPNSNGSRYFQKNTLRIGIIADEFLYQSYKDVANFIPITIQNYQDYKDQLDLLLVVTAWKGLDGSWVGMANPSSAKRTVLYKILNFYKKNQVKTVFYSKEDPVNYEKFIGIAKKCDYVFTTAKEKIKDYKKACKNDKVFVLEFGINPLYHNPIGMRNTKKSNGVFFAGSWLNKYPDRQKETVEIFEGVNSTNRNLKIIDRNFHLDKVNYFFPQEYLEYVSPAIEHEYLQKVHKLYDWAINLNSVKYSETMFANRIYELQAIGNIIISNYSVGVNNKFPNVFIVNDRKEVQDILNGFTDDEVYKHQVLGIRNAMSSHTTFQRFDDLLEKIGLGSQHLVKKVLVVADTINEDVIRDFENQTYRDKDIISEADFNEHIKSQYDIIAFFNSNYHYQEYYLEDMINGFKYTDSDYITKNGYFNGDELIKGTEHNYINEIKDKYKTIFWANAFLADELLQIQPNYIRRYGYCIDHFELNTKREVEVEISNSDYELSVIVPVYNNGRYLLNKCFNSLKRSSIFEKMQIIMVDDGSTDKETLITINRIAREHSNIVTYFFPEGGSGSASRARNRGVELANCEYVTYLDPDNEAVNDGYAQLLNLLNSNRELDFAIGNMIKFDNTKISYFKYYQTVIEAIQSQIINNPKQLLINTNLRAQSIQALVVKRKIITENQLKMVENAGGQDTLFFQELLLHSTKGAVIDLDIHIYYAAVTGSVTNTVTKKFFDKYYTLEKERLPFLINNDLLTLYMEKRFNFYFRNWYLIRIKRITDDDQKEAIDTLYKIYSLYKEYIKENTVEIDKFETLYKKGKYQKIAKYFSKI